MSEPLAGEPPQDDRDAEIASARIAFRELDKAWRATRTYGISNAVTRRFFEQLQAVMISHLDNWPVLQRSIELRNPYVDPMSYIQVRSIRDVRDEQDDERAAILRSIIDRSVTGVAAGLQNTG